MAAARLKYGPLENRKDTAFGILYSASTNRCCEGNLALAVFEQLVHSLHHFECIGDVDHVGLAAGPAAVRVERDGPAVTYEAPSDNVRLFAVTASGKALGVARRRACLPDLVHMGEEGKHGLPITALVDERLAAAERSACVAQEAEDQFAGFSGVNLSVGLFLGPSRAGDKQKLRVRPDRLRAPVQECECR